MKLIDCGDISEKIAELRSEEPRFNEEYVRQRRQLDYVRKTVEIRNRNSITQSEVAKRSGLSQQAVSRIEKAANNVTLATFDAYVEAIGAEIVIRPKRSLSKRVFRKHQRSKSPVEIAAKLCHIAKNEKPKKTADFKGK